MIDLAAMRAELEADEGRRSRVYLDTAGHRTIGVGWNLDANPIPLEIVLRLGTAWSLEADGLPGWAIDRLLELSINRACAIVDALCPRWGELDEDRRRVLVNLAFNLGPIGLARFKRFWSAIGQYLDSRLGSALDRAADEILGSLAAIQAPARYARLAARMRSGRPELAI